MRNQLYRRFSLSTRVEQVSIPSPDAFDFLLRLSNPKFDFTAARQAAKVLVPREIIDSLNIDNYRDVVRGPALRKEDFLSSSVSFLNHHGIECSEENVANCSDVLSGISRMYDVKNLRSMSTKPQVIIPTPTFGYYFKQLQIKGINFATLKTKKENGFLPLGEDIERIVDETGARVLLLCYPNNPTGVIMPKEKAKEIADIAKRKDLFVFSDEVFLKNSFKEGHCSIASMEGMLDRTATFFSISKMIGLSGIRTALCVTSKKNILSFSDIGGGYMGQEIVAAALNNKEITELYLRDCKKEILYNIELINYKVEELNLKLREIFGDSTDKNYVVPYIKDPEGGLTYLLDFSGLYGAKCGNDKIESGLDISKFLYEKAGVAVVPGECSGFEPQEMLVRLSLGEHLALYEKAFESIIESVSMIDNKPRSSPKEAGVVKLKCVTKEK